MRSGILFITLLIVSCGNSIPVRKYQLTKAEIEYKTDTKTLEKMLAKLMTNMHNGKVATTDQATTNCISRLSVDTFETVTLTLEQLNDLLASLTTSSSMVYVITNNGKIYVADQSNEGSLYDAIRFDYLYVFYSHPSSIWINRAPCPACANSLYETFKDTVPKLNLYVETFDYNATNYENLMQSVGCLAKLQSTFTLKAWNWATFKQTILTETVDCPIAINTETAATNYSNKKEPFTKFMELIAALKDGHTFGSWCVY